jgi:hypothetical protein
MPMTTTVRRLVAGDEAMLEAFLASTPETTLFMRSNLSRAGLIDDGAPFCGTYAGAFDGERLAGAAASFWNTNVIVAPGPHAAQAAAHAVALAGRRVGGILGPHDEVIRARAELGLDGATATFWSKEILYCRIRRHRLPAGRRLRDPPVLMMPSGGDLAVDAQPSGEITLYVPYSSTWTRFATPSASAPPEPPSPMMVAMIGTCARDIAARHAPIASLRPRSSAPMPGYAPGVSMKVKIGSPKRDASS